MTMYCLCQYKEVGEDEETFKTQLGAVNRHIKAGVCLRQPMRVVENGVAQFVRNKSKDQFPVYTGNISKVVAEDERKAFEDRRRHYPNVDLHQCPVCGALIVVE